MKKALFLFYLLAVFWQLVVGQELRTVFGTVTGPEGPLAGVSVSVKGGTHQVATDLTGKYVLSATDLDTLIFTNVGYETQLVAVSGREQVNVVLVPSTSSLDEVVVVGYGTQTRRNVTGSVAKVDMKQTENLPNTNVTQAIRGRVAGVQFMDNGRPGQSGSILIRGPRSLSGGNNPLIILDGIIFNAGIQNINPNDIASMEILKDASAAAIYGSRAANGVVIITSKKGVAEKPIVRFNVFQGISERAKVVQLLSPERYIERMRDYNRQAGLPAETIEDFLYASEIENMNSGKVVDHWDLVSQDGRIGSYDASLSGRSNRTNYFLSTSFVDEQGIFLNDQFKRISIRTNIENKITDWLTIGTNSTFMRRDQSGQVPGQASNIHPFSTPFYDDGEPRQYLLPEDQVSQGNPLYNALMTDKENIINNLFMNFYGVFTPSVLPGLSLRINYAPNYRWDHNYSFFRQDKHVSLNTTNGSKFNRQDFDWMLENIVTYKGSIATNHAFDVTLLYGLNATKQESTTSGASQFASDILGWNNMGLGGLYTVSSNASESFGVSSMVRLNYQFKQRYLATLTGRRDGSSVFAKNNKYAIFPSIGLSWIVSEEPFLQRQPLFDLLKLRLSYGAVGNQAISSYQSLSASGIRRYVFGDGGESALGIYPTRMENQNLRWETTYTANAAVDFAMLNNRINGTIEVYNMNTQDLLVQRSIPTMTGYSSVWSNLGGTNNKGLEVTVNVDLIRTDRFAWSTSIVASTNKNKIVKLYGNDADGDGVEDDDIGNRWFIGKPMNVAYDYQIAGVYQEEDDDIPSGYKPGDVRVKDLNNDGLITAAEDRGIIGQTGQPTWRWGIENAFKYNNFSFSFFINAMTGWMGSMDLVGNGLQNDRNFNRIDYGWWTPENRSNTMPSLIYTNPLGHGYYVTRNFIRIQDVSLSYDIPKAALSKIAVSDCRFFFSGKNLATFTKWPGADPESGANQNGIPLSRTLVIGLNFGF